MTVIEGGKMNFNLTTPSQLLPFLKGQKHAEKLMQKYLSSSHFEQERILRKAPELQMSPILDEFLFPKSKTHSTKDLDLYSGTGLANKTVINSWGELKDEEVKFSLIKAVDKKGRFEFIVQPEEDFCHLVICKVNRKFRGKGLFKKMVASIRSYCFEELEVNTISGNARPPRDENREDWRQDMVEYRKNFTTGEPVKLSKLHRLWLNQPYTIHGAIIGSDDAESFAILNPKQLQQFSKEDYKEWDETCPKQNKQNTFVELMKEVAA
ncbi:hypothetical protein N9046_01785 [Akkermansiaceae bacterium]|nr:hypothetical protein [Akkermansiaceae bacterium]MDB4658283.1 hypothetical protein [bacterium]